MKLPGVTKRAAAAISQVLLECPEISQGTHMASIGWCFDLTDEGETAAPCLGLSLTKDIPKECIVEAHGLTLAFVLTADIEDKYRNSVLDFVHNQFVFVDPSVAEWFDK